MRNGREWDVGEESGIGERRAQSTDGDDSGGSLHDDLMDGSSSSRWQTFE